MSEPDDVLMRIEDIAKFLGVSVRTVQRMIRICPTDPPLRDAVAR